MKDCAWCVYVFGESKKVLADALVLGYSLVKSNTRARMVACVDKETLELPESLLLARFWEVMPVSHLDIPKHLTDAGMQRLRGVYSKLQVWKLFDEPGPFKFKRVCMLDCDMLLRSHCDNMFSFNAPAAVMRGPTDNVTHEQRPSYTYYRNGNPRKYEMGLEPMVGGVNGGLIYFKPSVAEFDAMYAFLWSGQWKGGPMAEQEFLSHWYGRIGEWWVIPPEYNFQLHHVFISGQATPPHGQERSSKYHEMLHKPEIIKIWHYSGEKEPYDCLLGLEANDPEEFRDSKLKGFTETCMTREWPRMQPEVQADVEHIQLIKKVHQMATEEWILHWEAMWQELFKKTVEAVQYDAFAYLAKDASEITCSACNHIWQDRAEFDAEARDHVLANCPVALKGVEMSIAKCPNLMLLPFPPFGQAVEGRLEYLGKVLKAWQAFSADYGGWSELDTKLDPSEIVCSAAFVQPIIPMYQTVRGSLVLPAPPPPPVIDAPPSGSETLRALLRRFQRATITLGKHLSKPGFKSEKMALGEQAAQFAATLHNAAASLHGIINYRRASNDAEVDRLLRSLQECIAEERYHQESS